MTQTSICIPSFYAGFHDFCFDTIRGIPVSRRTRVETGCRLHPRGSGSIVDRAWQWFEAVECRVFSGKKRFQLPRLRPVSLLHSVSVDIFTTPKKCAFSRIILQNRPGHPPAGRGEVSLSVVGRGQCLRRWSVTRKTFFTNEMNQTNFSSFLSKRE